MSELVGHNQPLEAAKTLPKSDASLLQARFAQLPVLDQKIFDYGSIFIGANTAASGLVAHNLFGKLLQVRPSFIVPSLVVASIPFFQSKIFYELFIPNSLMAGKVRSPLHNTVGVLVGTVLGSMTAVTLAAAINTGYLVKYDTKPLQDSVFSFTIRIFRPVLLKMKYLFLFQAIFSLGLGYTHCAIYEKMLLLPPSEIHTEEQWR
ncbi:transmembrane protein 126A [Pseudophryne corroboree]|uniref:transmembrane protein 126A n=1 Tax=Pseudophryne corroboree TaxID=495146 RepID=UPI0030816C8D